MKPLLKIMLILGSIFLSTFVLLSITGVLTKENIESWLSLAQSITPIYVVILVALLLFADLFIAVPTLTVMLLAGFFLGAHAGAASALTGIMSAGIAGYWLSFFLGDRIMLLIIKDPKERQEVTKTFQSHGPVMILLSRAVPILPEVTACMAGMTRMSFIKFLGLWSLSAIPYTLIATYAGSISSLQEPKPAILTAIGLTLFFWTGWYVFNRYQRTAITNMGELS